MPKYTIQAVKFTCVDESGPDFFGSDEPLWVFTAKDPDGNVNTTRSKEFSDVDSGETRSFAKNANSIIWPRKGATEGAPGPIGLTIQLWEIDQGDPDAIAKKTNQAFDLAGLAPGIGPWVQKVPSVVRDQISKFIGNDLMGSKTLHFSTHRLEKMLPRVGASSVVKHRFKGESGDLPFEVAGGPDYDLFLRITRVS